jgi:hypothetical protein
MNQKANAITSITPKTAIAKFISLGAGFGEPGKRKKMVVMMQ